MKKFLAIASAWALPLLAAAQAPVRSVQDAAGAITSIINGTLVPLIFTIAFLVFIWGIFQYFIQGKDSDEKKDEAKKIMLYGIIGFFIMASVWGLVNILIGTFNLSSGGPAFIPTGPDPRLR